MLKPSKCFSHGAKLAVGRVSPCRALWASKKLVRAEFMPNATSPDTLIKEKQQQPEQQLEKSKGMEVVKPTADIKNGKSSNDKSNGTKAPETSGTTPKPKVPQATTPRNLVFVTSEVRMYD
jgi:hypothetical protein